MKVHLCCEMETAVRYSPQATGSGCMVRRHSKHPEFTYYFLLWLIGPPKRNEAIADQQAFWDLMRPSNLTNPAIIEKFGKQFLETTPENTKYAMSLLIIPGHEEYCNIIDQNLALVMQGNIAICHRSLSIAASEVAARWKALVQNTSVCPFGVSVPHPPRRGVGGALRAQQDTMVI
jgi:hypothetical protein